MQQPSAATGRRYSLTMVTAELGVPRSSVYAARGTKVTAKPEPAKRGPKTTISDESLLLHIRTDLLESPFVGEGHRKVWARLRVRGVRVSKQRILRLMRENTLLAPSRQKRVLGPRNHDGRITTDRPDVMWGTDLTTTVLRDGTNVSVMIAVDHCTMECVGIHAAKPAKAFEALEPIRQGLREHFGDVAADIARGLAVRHDNGPQYVSDTFQNELRFFGIESSPSFVRAPEGNGCSERFIRILKEQLLWVRYFDSIEELRLALHEWRRVYNEQWLLERHGFLSPTAARAALAQRAVA